MITLWQTTITIMIITVLENSTYENSVSICSICLTVLATFLNVISSLKFDKNENFAPHGFKLVPL